MCYETSGGKAAFAKKKYGDDLCAKRARLQAAE